MNELKFYQFGKHYVNMSMVAYMTQITYGAMEYMRFYFAAPRGNNHASLAYLDIPYDDYVATRKRIVAEQMLDNHPAVRKPIKGYWDE